MPNRSEIRPQMPRGAHSATAIATRPSTMKYQVPYWASDFCRAKKMIVPRIGPSIVPMPPMIVAKIISAEYCTLNAAVGSMLSWLMMTIAPAAPQPAAATTNTKPWVRGTRTPLLRAPTSSSRSAVSTRPSRLRRIRYTNSTTRTTTARAAQ